MPSPHDEEHTQDDLVLRLASRLRDLRRGRPYRDVAQQSGVPATTLESWEKKTGGIGPSVSQLAKLAAFYGVSIDYLVGVSEDQRPRLPAGNVLVDEDFESALQRVESLDELADYMVDPAGDPADLSRPPSLWRPRRDVLLVLPQIGWVIPRSYRMETPEEHAHTQARAQLRITSLRWKKT